MYIVNGEVVDNDKAMEWAKNNKNTEFISLYKGIHKKFKYNNGYFISYIYGKDWNHISNYYKSRLYLKNKYYFFVMKNNGVLFNKLK